MTYRIVVPHDYSPEADLALDWAATLVRSAGGSLVLLHVILVPAPPIPKLPMIPALRPVENPNVSHGMLKETAAQRGIDAEIALIETSDAGPGIVTRSRELGADLVVLGGSDPGRSTLSRAIRGSVIDYVVWHASSPVVVVRGGKADSA